MEYLHVTSFEYDIIFLNFIIMIDEFITPPICKYKTQKKKIIANFESFILEKKMLKDSCN